MKLLLVALALLFPLSALAQSSPAVVHPDDLPAITVSPGVELKELTGRNAATKDTRTEQASVAFFRLAPGRASAWSHNQVGEESFFILRGQGEVWTGNRAQVVRAGSFILIPPGVVRSVRASPEEALEFYAVTTPAWSRGDDVLVEAPEGAPK